jgi:hypothetical protein
MQLIDHVAITAVEVEVLAQLRGRGLAPIVAMAAIAGTPRVPPNARAPPGRVTS